MESSIRKIAFIINPIAGLQRNKRLPALVDELFTAQEGLAPVIYYTQCAGDAIQAARRFASEGYSTVVAMGGDGTVNEVAQGLVHSSTALGIVPLGSGNGLARHLRVPMSARKALGLIKKGRVNTMDYCTINELPFFCTAGVGFDATISHHFSQDTTRGPLTYMKHILRMLPVYKSERYVLRVDGREIVREAFIITFANASQWGNNGFIAPNADVSDGLLDLVVISKFPLHEAPLLGVQLLTKQIDKDRYVEVFQCKEVCVLRERAGAAHLDGEPLHLQAEVQVKLIERGLRVIQNDSIPLFDVLNPDLIELSKRLKSEAMERLKALAAMDDSGGAPPHLPPPASRR